MEPEEEARTEATEDTEVFGMCFASVIWVTSRVWRLESRGAEESWTVVAPNSFNPPCPPCETDSGLGRPFTEMAAGRRA